METEFFVPLSKLSIHPENVRKTQVDTPESIDGFAANLAEVGQLHAVLVKPDPDDPKRFFIADGGRRYKAFKKLAKTGTVPNSHPIRCAFPPKDDVAVTDVSLSANVMAAAMHPVDQYEAIAARAEAGAGEDDIARIYGLTVRQVRQRLALGRVAEPLRKECQKGKLTLDQLKAYAVTTDQERQLQVFKNHPSSSVYQIKSALTDGEVSASDRIAKFVGVDAYVQAGGALRQTLFEDDGAYLSDTGLLEQLAVEALKAKEADLTAQGWSFVDILDLHQSFIAYNTYPDHLSPSAIHDDPEASAKIAGFAARKAELVELYQGDDWTDEADAEYDDIEEQLKQLAPKKFEWTDQQKAQSGCCVFIGNNGALQIEYGRLRKKRKDPGTVVQEGPKDPISGALAESLSQVRTAILGAELIGQPLVALAAVVDATVGPVIYPPQGYYDADRYSPALSIKCDNNRVICDVVGDKTRAVATVLEAVQKWRERLPDTRGAFFDWCVSAGVDELLELLALGSAFAVSANLFRGSTSQQAISCDRLAGALDVDPQRWTDLTTLQVLSSAPKALAIQAVSDVHGEVKAAKLSGKKAEIVGKATELCNGAWLPWPLYRSSAAIVASDHQDAEQEDGEAMSNIAIEQVPAVDDGAMAPW